MNNEFMANLILLFHFCIVIFVLVAPFINIIAIWILHIIFCICMIIHWKLNNNICSLSVLEAKLRGLDYVETFAHKFVSPIYDISSSDWGSFTTVLTLIVLFISISKLTDKKTIDKIISGCSNNYFIKCINTLFEPL